MLTAMGFAVTNLLKINECVKRLKQVDNKGIFYADDEIGWFFKEVQKIQEALNEFTLK